MKKKILVVAVIVAVIIAVIVAVGLYFTSQKSCDNFISYQSGNINIPGVILIFDAETSPYTLTWEGQKSEYVVDLIGRYFVQMNEDGEGYGFRRVRKGVCVHILLK